MKEKSYLIKTGEFYFSDAGVSFEEVKTDFIKSILFVTEGNGALSFGNKEEAELFAKKIYINLGLACKVVEDVDYE